MNKIESISLNKPETQIKDIKIANKDNDTILSVSAEIRAVSAEKAADTITLISGAYVNSSELLSLFNWSFNVNDDEKYLKADINGTEINNINFNSDAIPVSSFLNDNENFSVSAYFTKISENTFMSKSTINYDLINVSVEWNDVSKIHLYFPNGKLGYTNKYNLEDIMVKKWNKDEEKDVETKLVVNTYREDVHPLYYPGANVLRYDEKTSILRESYSNFSKKDLEKLHNAILPVSAVFVSNDKSVVIDTNNDIHFTIVDAPFKKHELNYVVKTTNIELLRSKLKVIIKKAHVDWINFDYESMKYINLSLYDNDIYDDHAEFFAGTRCNAPDNTSFDVRTVEYKYFKFVNSPDWNTNKNIYINANESFDLLDYTCVKDRWIDNDIQYTKIIEPEDGADILNYYSIDYQNSDIDDIPTTILTPIKPIAKEFNTFVEAKLYDASTNYKSPLVDQEEFNIFVCSANININPKVNMFNTPNVLETRKGVTSSFIIDEAFNYAYYPTSIPDKVKLNIKADSWVSDVNYITGKEFIKNTAQYVPHLDIKTTEASAYITVDIKNSSDKFIIKPIKEFNIVEYGAPVFVSSLRPTFIFDINAPVEKSPISLVGYKNDKKDFDEKISVNQDVNIKTDTKNVEGVSSVTSDYRLPNPNVSSWEELVSALPGLYITNDGMLNGKIINLDVINALSKKTSLPYLITVNNSKTIGLTIDYAYLSAYTGKDEDILSFQRIPTGLVTDNMGFITSGNLSKRDIYSEYNTLLDVYTTKQDNTSAMLLSSISVARLLFFDYRLKNKDILLSDSLNDSFNDVSGVLKYPIDKLFSLAKNPLGLKSHVKFEVSGNDFLTAEMTSSDVIFKNTSNQYGCLSADINIYALSKSDFYNYETLLLDSGNVLIPFIPSKDIRDNIQLPDLYGKYFQFNVGKKEFLLDNIYDLIQDKNEGKYLKPKPIYTAGTVYMTSDDIVRTWSTQGRDAIVIYEDGRILYLNTATDYNMVIDSMNFSPVDDRKTEFENDNGSVSINIYPTLTEYGIDSIKNICNSEGFYITKDAPVSALTVYFSFQRPCYVHNMSFDLDYFYNDNDEVVLKNLPERIKVDIRRMLVDSSGNIYSESGFGHTIVPSSDFKSEHFTDDEVYDDLTYCPLTSVSLTFFVNNNTSDEYLFKIKNFKLSYEAKEY